MKCSGKTTAVPNYQSSHPFIVKQTGKYKWRTDAVFGIEHRHYHENIQWNLTIEKMH